MFFPKLFSGNENWTFLKMSKKQKCPKKSCKKVKGVNKWLTKC